MINKEVGTDGNEFKIKRNWNIQVVQTRLADQKCASEIRLCSVAKKKESDCDRKTRLSKNH